MSNVRVCCSLSNGNLWLCSSNARVCRYLTCVAVYQILVSVVFYHMFTYDFDFYYQMLAIDFIYELLALMLVFNY